MSYLLQARVTRNFEILKSQLKLFVTIMIAKVVMCNTKL